MSLCRYVNSMNQTEGFLSLGRCSTWPAAGFVFLQNVIPHKRQIPKMNIYDILEISFALFVVVAFWVLLGVSEVNY